MTHEPNDRRHADDLINEVVGKAVVGVISGAKANGVCAACTMRATTASMLLTIVLNEPGTSEDDFLDMVVDMLGVAFNARRALTPGDDDRVH
jgi:hypothetical protein